MHVSSDHTKKKQTKRHHLFFTPKWKLLNRNAISPQTEIADSSQSVLSVHATVDCVKKKVDLVLGPCRQLWQQSLIYLSYICAQSIFVKKSSNISLTKSVCLKQIAVPF